MGASQVEVTNRALRKIGANTIAAPNDSNAQARTTLDLFGTVARTELRKHAWSFAMQRQSLPKLSTAPAWGYLNAFQLPADCVKLVEVNGVFWDPTLRDIDTEPEAPWAIEGQQLLTDLAAPANIRFVSSDVVATPNMWDDCFVEVFACKLAMECAPTLTKSAAVVKQVAMDYAQAVFEAKRANAIELPAMPRADSSWITARAY